MADGDGQRRLWVLDVDFDGDGLLDVFAKVFVQIGAAQLVGIDQLYQQPVSHALVSTNMVFFPQYGGTFVVLDWLTAGDLDRDGRQDFVTTFTTATLNAGGTSLSGFMRAYYGSANGYVEGNANPLGGATAIAVVGDINGDGLPDVAASGPLKSPTMDGTTASIFLNNGMQSFYIPGLTSASGPRPYSIALADINHDSHPDIVVTNTQDSKQSSFTVLLNQGTGAFPQQNSPSYLSGYAQTTLAVGDLNGDKLADVVTVSFGSKAFSQPPQLIVYLNITP